jgi:hypothetical protein
MCRLRLQQKQPAGLSAYWSWSAALLAALAYHARHEEGQASKTGFVEPRNFLHDADLMHPVRKLDGIAHTTADVNGSKGSPTVGDIGETRKSPERLSG